MSQETGKVDGQGVAEVKHPLTKEAWEYIRAKSDTRYPYRMYLGVDAASVYKTLALMSGQTEPLTLDEVKMLVWDEGSELLDCTQCGRKFQAVAAVGMRVPNLEDADVRMEIAAKKEAFFGGVDEDIAKAYGRIAPFVYPFMHGDRAYPVIAGNIVPMPTSDSDAEKAAWEKLPFCGALYWHDKSSGRIRPNLHSHVVMAAKAVEERGLGSGHSFSMESADLVIERRTENFLKGQRIREEKFQKRTQEAGSISDFLEARLTARGGTRGRSSGQQYRRR